MLTYVQRTGNLYRDGSLLGTGYSGHGPGRNVPEQQNVHSVGPIPAGLWTVFGPPYDTETHGPYVMRLLPDPATDTFGRSGFLMHGDAIAAPGTASLGCIVMERPIRQAVWESGVRQLRVVADEPDDETTPTVPG